METDILIEMNKSNYYYILPSCNINILVFGSFYNNAFRNFVMYFTYYKEEGSEFKNMIRP